MEKGESQKVIKMAQKLQADLKGRNFKEVYEACSELVQNHWPIEVNEDCLTRYPILGTIPYFKDMADKRVDDDQDDDFGGTGHPLGI